MTKTDPVCGAQVDDKNVQATGSHAGKEYSFCSQACKDKFDRSPERYVKNQQQPAGREKVSR